MYLQVFSSKRKFMFVKAFPNNCHLSHKISLLGTNLPPYICNWIMLVGNEMIPLFRLFWYFHHKNLYWFIRSNNDGKCWPWDWLEANSQPKPSWNLTYLYLPGHAGMEVSFVIYVVLYLIFHSQTYYVSPEKGQRQMFLLCLQILFFVCNNLNRWLPRKKIIPLCA